MPVNLAPPKPEDLLPVRGVALGVAEAGVRKAERKDLLVMRLAAGASVAGVFTQNRFCAAPVLVCKEHLALRAAGARAAGEHRQRQRRHRRGRPGARAPHLRRTGGSARLATVRRSCRFPPA